MRIAISTGGGDAPGLNAVIRAAVLSAIDRGWTVLGVRRGFAGLLGEDDVIPMTRETVRGILHLGGTMLRSSRRNPFCWPMPDGSVKDRTEELFENFRNLGIDAMISIGGDGSLAVARQLVEKGMRIVSVPKTIDNDIGYTITTFGFDTAVTTALDAIDKLHTTAESHDRVMVLEVMGRHAGFIALHAGVAGSADVILIPEIPYDLDKVCQKIMNRDRAGRHFSIVVVAEGAHAQTGDEPSDTPGSRVGGVAEGVARAIEAKTGKECRALVLGHLQRGGVPTGYDRLLASRFGRAAVRAIEEKQWGHMVALQSPHIVTVPVAEVLAAPKRVDPDHDIVCLARETGISLGT